MSSAELLRLWVDCLNRFREASWAIHAGNQDILQATTPGTTDWVDFESLVSALDRVQSVFIHDSRVEGKRLDFTVGNFAKIRVVRAEDNVPLPRHHSAGER